MNFCLGSLIRLKMLKNSLKGDYQGGTSIIVSGFLQNDFQKLVIFKKIKIIFLVKGEVPRAFF